MTTGGASGATLTIFEGAHGAGPFKLAGEETTFGRAGFVDCRIVNEYVSRVHFALTRKGDAYEIEDRDSLNGVMLNGVKIRQPKRILDGDEIALGPVRCQFSCARPAAGKANKLRNLVIAGAVTAVVVGLALYYVATMAAPSGDPEEMRVRNDLTAAMAGAQGVKSTVETLLRSGSPAEAELLSARNTLDDNSRTIRRVLGDAGTYLRRQPEKEASFATVTAGLKAIDDELKKTRLQISQKLLPLQVKRVETKVASLVGEMEAAHSSAVSDVTGLLDSATPDFAAAAKRTSDAEREGRNRKADAEEGVREAGFEVSVEERLLGMLRSRSAEEAVGKLEELKAISSRGLTYLQKKEEGDSAAAEAALVELHESAAGMSGLARYISAEADFLRRAEAAAVQDTYVEIIALREKGEKRKAYSLMKEYISKYAESDDETILANIERFREMITELNEEAKRLYGEAIRELGEYRRSHDAAKLRTAKTFLKKVSETVGPESQYAEFAVEKLKELEEEE